MPVVAANALSKTFRTPERETGLSAAVRSIFNRRFKTVTAVDQVSFTIEEGEIVGFLGPNGAGKTTTLKMLTGLLHPTGGSSQVLGFAPQRHEPAFLRQISLVMGQRSQLSWDLPAGDSFEVQLAVYGVDRAQGRETLAELVELLDVKAVLKKPVRTLSLGERMKCELCMALLYRPRVLFLDEPTIGVDVTMQARIRQFIAEYNRRYKATVILTSHYMADVTALCKRVIVIDRGKILFDGSLNALSARVAPFKIVEVDLERDLDGLDIERYGTILSREARKVTLRLAKEETPSVTARLLAELPILDLTIQDPPIEDVIATFFAANRPAPAAEIK